MWFRQAWCVPFESFQWFTAWRNQSATVVNGSLLFLHFKYPRDNSAVVIMAASDAVLLCYCSLGKNDILLSAVIWLAECYLISKVCPCLKFCSTHVKPYFCNTFCRFWSTLTSKIIATGLSSIVYLSSQCLQGCLLSLSLNIIALELCCGE